MVRRRRAESLGEVGDLMFQRYGTRYTPKSFHMDEREFLLAVLRACPSGSLVEFDQCEPEEWVHRLREWSQRSSAAQFEADNYRIDDRFIAALDELIESDPAPLIGIHHMSIMGRDNCCLMASVDNFSILTTLDDAVRDKLIANQSHGGQH
jgi:hypothetical protein